MSLFALALGGFACGAGEAGARPADAGLEGEDSAAQVHEGAPGRRAVSADFLQRTLTFLDLDRVAPGIQRSSVQTGTLDLSAYGAAPLNVEITPDGKLALVSLSAGFFAIPGAGLLLGGATIPADPGRLLFVDLARRQVSAELDSGAGPMGIAFAPDKKRAFVCHFLEEHVAIVDLETHRVLERVHVGPFSEEIALDDSGSVGILSYSAAGNLRTFSSADMAGTLSPPIELMGDSAGVAFFPGTKIAYGVQAPMPLLGAQGGHVLVDVSDPSSPKVREDERDPAAPVAYPAVAVPPRGSVVVPVASGGRLALNEIKLDAQQHTTLVQTVELGSTSGILGAYGVTWEAGDRVLLSVPGDRNLIAVDLASGEHVVLPWELDQPGPTDIAVY